MQVTSSNRIQCSYAAVVFDFDGTLADTREAILATMQDTLQTMGLLHVPEQAIVQRIGLPLTEILGALGVPGAALDEASGHYRRLFPAHSQRVVLFSGALRSLQALRAQGVMVGIASSRGRASLLDLVGRLGLQPLLRDVLGAEDTQDNKPAPGPVLTLAKRWSVPLDRIWVVGDTSFDMAMARAAGAWACGVTHGSHGPARLKEGGAHVLINHLDELLHALTGTEQGVER